MSPGVITEHQLACTRVAAQFPQRWLRSYVESKLRRDPVFQAAYELFSGTERPILDLGCGVGLLAFYLRERGCMQPVLGLDLDARKIGAGVRIARDRYDKVELMCRDVRERIPQFAGDVVLFDLLHYLAPEQQTSLLSRLAPCVASQGLLVVRDGLCGKGGRYWMTWGVEKFAQILSWNLKAPLHFPSGEQISRLFSETEFNSEMQPMWGSMPFSNYLLVFRRK